MNKIQQAATNLLNRGDITKDEYNSIEKVGFSLTGLTEAIKKNPVIIPMSVIGLAGTAALIKEMVVDPLSMKSKINKSFDLMQQKVPQLAEKDQDQLRDYFEVVKTYSPRAAANPLVAGALVNKMMEFGGVDHKLIQDISEIESNKEKPEATSKMMDAAAKAGFNTLTNPGTYD